MYMFSLKMENLQFKIMFLRTINTSAATVLKRNEPKIAKFIAQIQKRQ